MAIGGGKYASLSEAIIRALNADAVGIIIAGGDDGSGFSIAAKDIETVRKLQASLRHVADKLEDDIKELESKVGKNNAH